MRRLLVVLIGLVMAIAAGVMFLAVGGLAVPATRELAAELTLGGAFATIGALANADSPDLLWGVAVAAFWSLTAALLVLPPLVAAVVGEVAGLRSFVWYAGFPGLLTAAIAWIGYGSGGAPGQTATTVLTLLFLTGAVAGLVYWAIAGRNTGFAVDG